MVLKVSIKDRASPALLELSKDISSKGLIRKKDGADLIKEIRNVIRNDWQAQRWPDSSTTTRLEDSFRAGPVLKYQNSRVLEVESTSPYAAIHNRSSTVITPKNGPWLAIPLARAEAFFGTSSLVKSLIWNEKYHIKKATITMKPKGSVKGYLDIAAERFQEKQAITVVSRVRSLWQNIIGRFK